MKKQEIPSLSRRDSMLFLHNPDEFKRRVRTASGLGQMCQVKLGRTAYVLTNELGRKILEHADVGMMDGKGFGPFVGASSVLLIEGDPHTDARAIAEEFAERLKKRQGEVKECVTQAVHDAQRQGLELGHEIRLALLRWTIEIIIADCFGMNKNLAVDAAMKWLECADNWLLFIRPLRYLLPFTKDWRRWMKMKRTRSLLVQLLGYSEDPLRAAQALTIILGVVDNPVTTALGGMALGQQTQWKLSPGELVKAILEEDPALPYIVRVALQDLEINGIKFPKGTGFLVDVQLIKVPKGAGDHECPAFDLGGLIAMHCVKAFDSDKNIFIELKRGRTRFAIGVLEGCALPKVRG